MSLTSDDIMEFLSDPARRPLINWSSLEKAAGLSHRRINMVSRNEGSSFSNEEIGRLVEVLGRLEFPLAEA